jgi:NADH dehydrogenase/NADH:ubiquinone oxidoreductase subunit G
METKTRLTIDGIQCEAEPGEYLLSVAKRYGIEIPTLCHHDALPGQASCRLCVVEVIERGRSNVVVSCVYPAADGIEVLTKTEKIKRLRSNILCMLMERAPANNCLDALCLEYGVKLNERFLLDRAEKCVLCGLCAKACALLGMSAITTAMRGTFKKVTTPFGEPSSKCIGCSSCFRVCPSGAIELSEANGKRQIWGKEFDLLKCAECGTVFATPEEIEHLTKKGVVFAGSENLCAECRKKAAVLELPINTAQVYRISRNR